MPYRIPKNPPTEVMRAPGNIICTSPIDSPNDRQQIGSGKASYRAVANKWENVLFEISEIFGTGRFCQRSMRFIEPCPRHCLEGVVPCRLILLAFRTLFCAGINASLQLIASFS